MLYVATAGPICFFYLNSRKRNNKKEAEIILRVTLRGQSCEYATGVWIKPSHWNSEQRKVSGEGDRARDVNDHLLNLKIAAEGICMRRDDIFDFDVFFNFLLKCCFKTI
jgi:hypothetical protein